MNDEKEKRETDQPKYSDSTAWSFCAVVALAILLPEYHHFESVIVFFVVWALFWFLSYVGFVVIDVLLSGARKAQKGRMFDFAIKTILFCVVYWVIFSYIH